MKSISTSEIVAEILRLQAVFEQGQVLLHRMLIAARIAEAEEGTERGEKALDRTLAYSEELARIAGAYTNA